MHLFETLGRPWVPLAGWSWGLCVHSGTSSVTDRLHLEGTRGLGAGGLLAGGPERGGMGREGEEGQDEEWQWLSLVWRL